MILRGVAVSSARALARGRTAWLAWLAPKKDASTKQADSKSYYIIVSELWGNKANERRKA